MSEQTWKYIDWTDCPFCGSDLEVLTDLPEGEPQQAWDGDEVRCTESCEAENLHMSVDMDDGHGWIGGDW